MKTKGVKILDSKDEVISVQLPDILAQLPNGDAFHWSLLYVDGITIEGSELPFVVLADRVDHSKKGLILNWQELNKISKSFDQIYDIIIIGCKEKKLLFKYDTNREACEICDIFIEMFDGCYWQVFSKDEVLIHRIAEKFEEIELLDSDQLVR